uniref:Uncharacterized protein n=1 Tax=Lygus hesperus TaxID=30085 RepID=A0A146LFY3_LYGHE
MFTCERKWQWHLSKVCPIKLHRNIILVNNLHNSDSNSYGEVHRKRQRQQGKNVTTSTVLSDVYYSTVLIVSMNKTREKNRYFQPERSCLFRCEEKCLRAKAPRS